PIAEASEATDASASAPDAESRTALMSGIELASSPPAASLAPPAPASAGAASAPALPPEPRSTGGLCVSSDDEHPTHVVLPAIHAMTTNATRGDARRAHTAGRKQRSPFTS